MDEADRAKEKTLAILEDVFTDYSGQDFTVRLWDGTIWPEKPVDSPVFTLVLNHPGALRQMFLPPSELNLGESYIYGDFNVDGDLIGAFPPADYVQGLDLGLGDKLGLAWQLRSLPGTSAPREGRQAVQVSGDRHSRGRDRQAISYHYDVSNDFYRLWLDKNMVYSCAYFTDPGEDIHTAQERKLDYICRKLRLQPGERLLDVGCGWGGLVIYQQPLCLPRRRVGADPPFLAVGRGDRLRGAGHRIAARALRADAASLGAPSGEPARPSLAARGRGHLSNLATVHVRVG